MNDQLRSDLERLRIVVAHQWTDLHCLLVCMNDVMREEGIDYRGQTAYGRKLDMTKALGFRDHHVMYRWNDASGRTKQEVLDRIDTALEAA